MKILWTISLRNAPERESTGDQYLVTQEITGHPVVGREGAYAPRLASRRSALDAAAEGEEGQAEEGRAEQAH